MVLLISSSSSSSSSSNVSLSSIMMVLLVLICMPLLAVNANISNPNNNIINHNNHNNHNDNHYNNVDDPSSSSGDGHGLYVYDDTKDEYYQELLALHRSIAIDYYHHHHHHHQYDLNKNVDNIDNHIDHVYAEVSYLLGHHYYTIHNNNNDINSVNNVDNDVVLCKYYRIMPSTSIHPNTNSIRIDKDDDIVGEDEVTMPCAELAKQLFIQTRQLLRDALHNNNRSNNQNSAEVNSIDASNGGNRVRDNEDIDVLNPSYYMTMLTELATLLTLPHDNNDSNDDFVDNIRLIVGVYHEIIHVGHQYKQNHRHLDDSKTSSSDDVDKMGDKYDEVLFTTIIKLIDYYGKYGNLFQRRHQDANMLSGIPSDSVDLNVIIEDLYYKALSLQPMLPELYHNFGVFYNHVNVLDKAEIMWKRAVELNPRAMYLALGNIATMECARGDLKSSQLNYVSALNIARDNQDMNAHWGLMLQSITGAVPMIVPAMSLSSLSISTSLSSSGVVSTESIVASIRHSYVAGMLKLLESSPKNAISNAFHVIGCGSLGYYIIYHGYEDYYLRQLQFQVFWHLNEALLRYTAGYLRSIKQNDWEVDSVVLRHPSPCSNPLVKLDHTNKDEENDLVLFRTELKSNIAVGLREEQSKRIKVGFLSAFFYGHSVGLLTQGVIRRINRNMFNVYLIMLNANYILANNDAVTQSLLESLPKSNVIPCYGQDIINCRENIAALQLDVLVFTEIGMDHMSYFLAFSRSARRSLVFWGHAVTSGITSAESLSPNSGGPDYFVSSVLFEGSIREEYSADVPLKSLVQLAMNPKSADNLLIEESTREAIRFSQLEYTERLLLLNSLSTYFYHPGLPFTRSQLGNTRLKGVESSELPQYQRDQGDFSLPTKKEFLVYLQPELAEMLPASSELFRVYAIPQTLYKLHPSFDYIIQDILISDPNGFITFPVGDNVAFSQQILERWKGNFDKNRFRSSSFETIDEIFLRLIFVRRMNSTEYLTFCAIADIVLDPYPVGGGRSSLEIFSTGTPIVLLSSRTSILQLTLGMYSLMRTGRTTECCVAYNASQYVSMAVYTATNRTFNQYLRSRIRKASKIILYENQAVINEWEKMLTLISKAPRPARIPSRIDSIASKYGRLPLDCTSEKLETIAHDVLRKNSLWKESELKSATFYHPTTPIILADIKLLPCQSGNEPDGICISVPLNIFVSSTANGLVKEAPASDFLDNTRISQKKPNLGNILPIYFTAFSDVSRSGRHLNATILVSMLFESHVLVNGLTLQLKSGPLVISDWREDCLREVRLKGLTDKLKILFVCSVTGRAVHRLEQKVIEPMQAQLFDSVAQRDVKIALEIREYDELGLIVQLLRSGVSQYGVKAKDILTQEIIPRFGFHDHIPELADILGQQFLSAEISGADDWIHWREHWARDWLFRFQIRDKSDVNHPTDSELLSPVEGLDLMHSDCRKVDHYNHEPTQKLSGDILQKGRFRVVIGLTTCKRLEHFKETVNALLRATNLPNDFFIKVIVVDDGSPDYEIAWMKQNYPTFEYILKGPNQKGHAQSMNILVHETLRTIRLHRKQFPSDQVYFLYLEDDWRLLPKQLAPQTLARTIDSIQGRSTKFGIDSLVALVSAAASVLFETSLENDNSIAVDQVLFNDQTTRPCAIAHSACDLSTIGSGSWLRNLTLAHSQRLLFDEDWKSSEKHEPIVVPYRLHEFSLLPVPSMDASSGIHRSHEFSNWPGLSLNPGLWNLERIVTRLSICLYGADDSFSPSNLDIPIFNTNDILFEQRFSVTGLAAGLHMAYFPALVFEHTGDLSAYVLNEQVRPWD